MPDYTLNESETRAELVSPALREAGWGVSVTEGSRVQREFPITRGRLLGAGKRGKPSVADYVLEFKNQKLAVVEAKKISYEVSEGVGQAKQDADRLMTPFAFSTNGLGIYQIDMRTGDEGEIDKYPSPEELWDKVYPSSDKKQYYWLERFSAVPYEDKGGRWEPRYFQHNAIEKSLEAITNGQDRLLLTLATGTGKTAIACQICWKLFKSRWNLTDWRGAVDLDSEPRRTPRILFLADRNVLASQAFNEFDAFPEDARVRIKPDEIRADGKVPKNASIFFTIFQTFMSGKTEDGEPAPYFGQYSRDFFDLIIIDECHRGGANEESTWRGIMEYFYPAVQIGLTATPRRNENIDTYNYFGEPVYKYSLKQGINDGYLTPFKVKQFATTLDDYVYKPDDHVIEGDIEEGKIYTEKAFNLTIEIKERELYRVTTLMNLMNQREKTLVFCKTQAHAAIVRDMINSVKSSRDPFYCVRVTSNDGNTGDQHLREFRNNERTIPTILTTSRKLSTGIDALNIRNIVLLREINDIIEFKQIIGRGTRIFDGKDFFTIYDFVRAHEHFSDPDWDGEPEEPVPPLPTPPDQPTPNPNPPSPPRRKIKVKLAAGKDRLIQHMMATTFWNPDGSPMSSAEFIESLFGDLPNLIKDEDQLRALWRDPKTRAELLRNLEELRYGDEQLSEVSRLIDAEDADIYDVLAYVAYALKPKSRSDRAETFKTSKLGTYDEKLQIFLGFVLGEYVERGVGELQIEKLPELLKLQYGSEFDGVQELGGDTHLIRKVFTEFQQFLY